MDVMTNVEQQTDEDQQTVTIAIAKQVLKPTFFNKDNIEQLKQIQVEEVDKTEVEVIELKDNFLPKGLTPREDMFDANDVPRKPKLQPINTEIEEHNIGTAENLKMIKLSKNLPPDQKPKYIYLFK